MGILRDNPILWREGVPRILRRASPRTHLRLAAGLVLLSIGAAVAAHRFTRNWEDPGLLASLIAVAWAAATVILAPARTARGVVGERQQGTWEAIVLTRLRPGEIVVGKLLGALAPLWIMGLLLLPACLALMGNTRNDFDLRSAHQFVGISFAAGLIGAPFFAAQGLFISMLTSTVTAAFAWTYLVIALAWPVAPLSGTIAFLALLLRFRRLAGPERGRRAPVAAALSSGAPLSHQGSP
jgi:ABC-type transport system involved in cytochrome c biogenesis permease component